VNIIKLNAIDSTNSYLIELGKKERLTDPTIVVSEKQLKGRGQLGATWQSKPMQSLTFSVFKRFKGVPVLHLSSITFAVSIGVYKTLNKMLVPQLRIKWPNDILSYSKKLAGILIENQIKQGEVVSTVIGIGININEEKFENLPHATSMLLSTGRKHLLDEVLHAVSEAILKELERVEQGKFQDLKKEYENTLFRKNIVSVFEDTQGNRFNGKIKGVSEAGELLIEKEDEKITSYLLKEIKYLL